jgi:hypothetical protein
MIRWDIIFYCAISLIAPHVPLVGTELQVGALVAALCLIPD